EPLVEGLDPDLVRLRQPVEVIRQIELAGASRNAAAVLDGIEEIRVLERLQVCDARVQQLRAQAGEVRDQGLQTVRVDARLRLELRKLGELPLELLERLRTHVAARGDRQDIDQARHGGARAPLA